MKPMRVTRSKSVEPPCVLPGQPRQVSPRRASGPHHFFSLACFTAAPGWYGKSEPFVDHQRTGIAATDPDAGQGAAATISPLAIELDPALIKQPAKPLLGAEPKDKLPLTPGIERIRCIDADQADFSPASENVSPSTITARPVDVPGPTRMTLEPLPTVGRTTVGRCSFDQTGLSTAAWATYDAYFGVGTGVACLRCD